MQPAPVLPALTTGLRLLLGLLGAGSFGGGVVAVFVTQNGTGTAVLLGFGGILLVVALLGNRLDSFEFGGAKLRLRAAAAERFAVAEDLERRGDSAGAERVRAQAQALLDAAGPIAADYRSVRSSMSSSPERTRALQEVVARARRLATEQSFDRAEVVRWLRDGSEAERITALGMMQAKPELRDFAATLEAIEQPRSAFEHYHAMRLAVEMADGLDPGRRAELARAVRSVRGLRFRRDTQRWQLSEELLRRLDVASPGVGSDLQQPSQ